MPNAALAEMYAHDQALGVDPIAVEPAVILGDPPPAWVPPPLRPEPPDWAAEEAERREREAKAERDRLQREIERLKLEEVPSHHPPARRGGP